MNIEQLFPKKWLSAGDLGGHAVNVTISAVTLETVRNPRTNREEAKLAVAFAGKQKRLLLNKTQAYALAALAGKETDDWIGRQVTLSGALAPNGALTVAITAAAKALWEEVDGRELPGANTPAGDASCQEGEGEID